MTAIRVLIVDNMMLELGLEAETAIDLETRLFSRTDTYVVNPKVVAYLKALKPDDYDLIVVGNNNGAGVEKAAAMPVALRSRTVIVWNSIPGAINRGEYEAMGFIHFSTRESLWRYLRANPAIYGSS